MPRRHRLRSPRARILLGALIALGLGCGDDVKPPRMDGPTAGWSHYGGDPGGTRYSPLTQIDRDNVGLLEPAWTFRTGDWPHGRSDAPRRTSFQATPVIDAGVLYFCSPLNRIFALDPETGRQLWVYDAEPQMEGLYGATCRGVALWRGEPAADGSCARRVFMGTVDARLVAVDAHTGRACGDFGESGVVDLRQGIGDIQPGEYAVTSPPVVVDDVVVVGSLVGDNRRVNGPGGVVRAFDAHSGALRWAFDPVPPGTEPLEPDPDGGVRYHRGTPNAWGILSADIERGLVFVPFGGPSPDFYGGHRRGFDYFGSSVVALDAASGRVAWHFQAVHHDLWDYDVGSQPTLLELRVRGATVPALLQPTKMGHLFVLDRETGEPLYPVEERPVPQTDVPGETTSPTQPFPTFPPPLHPARLDPEDPFGFTPWDRARCRETLSALRNEGMFTPPSLRGSVSYPGTAGGFNWGGAAWDPQRRIAVLNQSRIPTVSQLLPRTVGGAGREPRKRKGDYASIAPQAGTPYRLRQSVPVSPFGVPCAQPPWGTLLAVSLDSGERLWEIPFGTSRDMTPLPFGIDFGLPNMGGPIVTASGLVFIGAALDDYIRAYDIESGEELWRGRLPAGGQATPMTYRLRPDSRQFVVLAAGGHGMLGTHLGDHLIAYALPETR